MPFPFRRLFGILVAFIAAASLLLSTFVIVQTWILREKITDRGLGYAREFADLLTNTSITLEWFGEMAEELVNTVSTTQTALLTLSKSAHETTDLLDSLIVLTGETLPEFIATTQNSVESARNTAQVIDGFMNALSKIPFINIPYNPEETLSASLANISADLEQFQPQLKTMQSDLIQSQTNLEVMESQVEDFAGSLQTAKEELSQAVDIIAKYSLQVSNLQQDIASFEKKFSGWIQILAWGITFIFGWLIVLQGYICYRGIYLMMARDHLVNQF